MTLFYEPWLQFKHPIVRQLAFSIASPNILKSLPHALELQHHFALHQDQFWQAHFSRYVDRLIQLDQNPTELIDFLKPLKSTRLGLRFEHLIWFWLQDAEYHHFQLLGHSIQIIEGKNTIGELDFLILNLDTNCIEHWEVALKFYLAEADLLLPNWYGLNRSDTLLRKLSHFTQKQFQFQQVQQRPIQKRFAVLKGQLYVPEQTDSVLNHLETLPNWINPSRRIGHWGNSSLKHYYRVQRQEWICPNWEQSSQDATYWQNGLYRNFTTQADYMFRQAEISHNCVRVM